MTVNEYSEYIIPMLRVVFGNRELPKAGAVIVYKGCLVVYRVLEVFEDWKSMTIEPCFCNGDKKTAYLHEIDLNPTPVSIAYWKKVTNHHKLNGGLYVCHDGRIRIKHGSGRLVSNAELYNL